MAFVNKQLFWQSASIASENTNDVLTDFYPFFSHFTLTNTSVGLTSYMSIVLFFSLKIVDPYDHYAACCVPLIVASP